MSFPVIFQSANHRNRETIAAFLAADSSQCDQGDDRGAQLCRQGRELLVDAFERMEEDTNGAKAKDLENFAKYAAAGLLCANVFSRGTRCPEEDAVERQSLKKLIKNHEGLKAKN
jgi:hypothetical protein